MNQFSRSKLQPPDYIKDGNEAFLAGRFNLAAQAFAKAHRNDPRNPVPLFNLASAKERTGDIDEAAANLTRALRLRPGWSEPAQRLSLLLARYVLPTPGELNPHGLLAAFAFDNIDQQPIAGAAIAFLRAQTPLGEAVKQAANGRALEAARALLLRRTEKTLSHPLLHAALARDVNFDPDVERLLTAMRRIILLELPSARMEDRALIGFIAALLQQCLNNEYVFSVSPEEKSRLQGLTINWDALANGNPSDARRLLLHLLYEPPHVVIGDRFTGDDCRKFRPRACAEIIANRMKEDETLSGLAKEIPSIGVMRDPTSQRVAQQYEEHPYPRWTSLLVPAKDSARRTLERFFAPERLSFLEEPFKVLIAGAGTGMQAISVAARYGDNADVLAIDLSRRSLAYAKARAAQFGVENVRFAQADILNLTAETTGLFDVVESVGVLHHLADPFEGWRALLRILRPGGLMTVGLYSAISRQNIAALRAAADYPGPGCSDEIARDYRTRLAQSPEETGELSASRDFYALSNFRDLILHEHERPVSLNEIADFMRENDLAFRGFVLPSMVETRFLETFSSDALPGAFENWAAFEEQYPRTFDGMYQFWCEKRQ